jgi:hypothetical protein
MPSIVFRFGSGSLLTGPAAGKINNNISTPIEGTSALTLALVFGAVVLLDA